MQFANLYVVLTTPLTSTTASGEAAPQETTNPALPRHSAAVQSRLHAVLVFKTSKTLPVRESH